MDLANARLPKANPDAAKAKPSLDLAILLQGERMIELLALPRRSVVSPGFASGELTGQRPLAAGVIRGTYSRG